MTNAFLPPWFAAACACIFLGSCGPGRGETNRVRISGDMIHEVIFSVANQDEGAPSCLMEVSVDGEPVVYGMMPLREGGDYLYINTRLENPEVVIRVVSEFEGDLLTAKKQLTMRNKTWVVVTRLRDMGGEPELMIEASYEAPGPIFTDLNKER